ncbi:MAG: outer membrane protein assembly factor BamE [Sphingopyxis sp.]|nr:outer membrane protein assembly factor BamE [Sphingopyxis sp.]
MNASRFRTAIIGGLIATTLLSGCAQLRGRQGYVVDPVLSNAIAAGVDNRESVEKTLGRPTFVGQFGSNDYFYVSRETRQLAFANPRPVAQTVVHVKFDATGNVVAIDNIGLENIARISPNGDATPTLGRERSFFEDIFGNIGAVGAPGAGAPQR